MRDERGVSESTQWAMLTPVVLLLVFGIIQLGLWGYGRTVALNAAGAAAEEAAPLGATTADGEAAARAIAERGGLLGVRIQVKSEGDQVVAFVTGRVPGLVDVGMTSVDAQVTRAKERVTGP